MDEVLIRKATVGDAKGIAAISPEFLRQHAEYSPLDPLTIPTASQETASWKKLLQSNKYCVYVAVKNKQIVGFASLFFPVRYDFKKIKKVGEIEAIFVSQQNRYKGIGKKLFKTAVSFFKSKGVTYIQLNVRLKNPALDFWKNLGFKEFDVRMYLDITKTE
jgi:ribosomal protein S18 acetylase RimI-like enzyme